MCKSDRIILSMVVSLIAMTIIISFGDFAERCEQVRENSLRLHIIASSNEDEDQRVKLVVRDKLLEEYGEILGKCGTSQQAAGVADFLKEDIQRTAVKALLGEDCDDDVAVSVTDTYFDTRNYEQGVTMPAGEYKALRVTIGEAEGENWWCVMYPPICIPAASQQRATRVEEQIKSLSETPCFEARFAVVELYEKIKSSVDKGRRI